MMSPKQILIAAKTLLENPDRWAKNARVLDSDGYSVDQNYPLIARWDAVAAVEYCQYTGIAKAEQVVDAIFALRRAVPQDLDGVLSISTFNDNCSHDELMRLFDTAITRCE